MRKTKNASNMKENFKKAMGLDIPKHQKKNNAEIEGGLVHIFSPKNKGMLVKVIERRLK